MKNLILFLPLLLIIASSCGNRGKNIETDTNEISTIKSGGIIWQNIETAKDLATKSKKDIFIFVYAPWCPKCKDLRETTFKDPVVIDMLNTHFIPVQLNAQESKSIQWNGKEYANPNFDATKSFNSSNSYNELVYELKAEAIPSMLVMDHSLNTLASILGYKESNRLLWRLSDATGRFDYKLKK